MGVNTRNM